MTFTLTDAELDALRFVPDDEIAHLAAELDFVPDAEINRRQLLEDIVPRLLELGRTEGLPFSKYDRDDLEALSEQQRGALARHMGWSPRVGSMIRSGRKVYKIYRNIRKTSQIPVLLPLLLPLLARHAEDIAASR